MLQTYCRLSLSNFINTTPNVGSLFSQNTILGSCHSERILAPAVKFIIFVKYVKLSSRGDGACLANILISNAKIVPPQKWSIIRHDYMNSTICFALSGTHYSPIKCKAEAGHSLRYFLFWLRCQARRACNSSIE